MRRPRIRVEWKESVGRVSMGWMIWNTHQSRSISPNLNPPSFDLPSVGCLVKFALGPVGRACILSMTMCCLLAELFKRSERSKEDPVERSETNREK